VPDSVRDTGIADVIGRATGSDALRATHLERILKKGALSAQLEAVRASAGLPIELALPRLIEALSSAQPALIGAALRALSARAPDIRARADVLNVLTSAAARAAEAPEAARAFLQAAQALVRPSSVSPLDPVLATTLETLAAHPAVGVRLPARALLEEWQQPLPSEPRPVDAPLPAADVPAADDAFHVKLWTSGGTTLELVLDAAHAPAAVARFVALLEAGALNDMPVASLAAGKLIAFRPKAPATFALRHEDTAQPVIAGSVVLQDHGRDAAGPGFALVLARAPELDRRVTVLGRLASPLEEALALHAGDRIERAELIKAR
jgi:hypothetical protein